MDPIGMMKPVLLKDETKAEEMVTDGWTAELKYDGFGTQCIVEKGIARFFARSPAAVAGEYTEYTDHVPHLTENMAGVADGYYFGELYIDGMESAKLGTLHGTAERTKVLMKEHGLISFVVYDYIRDATDKSIYTLRREKICKTVQGMENPGWSVSHVLVGVALNVALTKMVKGEIEGVVLKKNDSQYYASTKSRSRSCWKKIKAVHTDDLVVFSAVPGQGKYEGQIGALSVGKYMNGEPNILTTISGFTDEQRKDFEKLFDLIDGTYVIKTPITIEIAFMEKTSGGGFRHPRYLRKRPDKSPSECIIEIPKSLKKVRSLDDFF